MLDTYLVDANNAVFCANEGFIVPKRKYVAKITCDSRDYTFTAEDTSICDIHTGVALQISIWLKGQRCLDTLPHFRTWQFI